VVALYHIVCRDLEDWRYRMDMFVREKTDFATAATVFRMICGVSDMDIGCEYLPISIDREFSVLVDKSEMRAEFLGSYDSKDVDAIIDYRRKRINAEVLLLSARDAVEVLRKRRAKFSEARIYRLHFDSVTHIRILLGREHSMRWLVSKKESMFGYSLIYWIAEERLLLDIAESDGDMEVLINFLPNELVRVSRGKIESAGVEELYAFIKREKYCHNVVRRRWCVWNPRSCGEWPETPL
jgi:hypothetical protein